MGFITFMKRNLLLSSLTDSREIKGIKLKKINLETILIYIYGIVFANLLAIVHVRSRFAYNQSRNNASLVHFACLFPSRVNNYI